MSGKLSILIIAAALVACSGNELVAPVSGPPARFITYGNDATPRGQVTRVASNPSFEMDAPPVAEVGNLCTYRARKDPVMQGYADCTREQFESAPTMTEQQGALRALADSGAPERATALADQLCEKKVAELVESSAEIRQENIDLRCHVFEQAYCALPPAPPPPPAPAKKK
jgi:hypothetical protein